MRFLRKQPVLSVAAVLAIISAFFVLPDATYLSYPDYRTLALLFCLMAVVAGWRKTGVFVFISEKLLDKVGNQRGLVQLLVALCFFSSMFITNDVALIAFVPFGIYVEIMAGLSANMIIFTVVMQTVAANLGSMLLPIGNPQNLYLYNLSGQGMGEFILLMLPVWVASFVLIFATTFFIKGKPLAEEKHFKERAKVDKKWIVFMILFILCLATVAGFVPFYVVLAVVILALLIFDREIFRHVDYCLLLTFLAFFIFIGNMKRIDAVSQLIASLLTGREFLVGVLASQVISNVPAAILLSGFTDKISTLILATDIGGLGTPIASLASLISMNEYLKSRDANPGKYLGVFMVVNILFLVVLCAFKLVVL